MKRIEQVVGVFLFFLGVLISPNLMASGHDTQDKTSTTVHSGTMSSLEKQTSTALPKYDNSLSKHDKHLAKQWTLTNTDWLKFKQIMRGPRGIWSPNIDPITALGVSEEDPIERQRYAELWIKIETKRAELELAFEVERQRAAKSILGDQLAVNNQAWIEQWKIKRDAISKEVVLFVDADCKEQCHALFDELHASVGDNARLDIFFKQGASSDDIGQWASFMNIAPKAVRERQVTLNFDEGKFQAMQIDIAKLPQVRVVDLDTGKISETYK